MIFAVTASSPIPFPVSGAILAGGRSSRMGRDKAFINIDGVPLIARQAALLRSVGIDDLIISGRNEVDYGVPDARVVTDPVADAGPLSGLVAILNAARHAWVLVVAVDLPHLTPAYLQNLLSTGGGRTGVVPHGPHGYEPLAALYPRTSAFHAQTALQTGQLQLQRFIKDEIANSHLIPLEISDIDSPLLTNWNTPSDAQA